MNDALLRRIGKDSIVLFKPSMQTIFDVDICADNEELWLARFIRRDNSYIEDQEGLQYVSILCAMIPLRYDDSNITKNGSSIGIINPVVASEEFSFKYKNFDKTEIIIPSIVKVSPVEMYVNIPGMLQLMELDSEEI